MKAARSLVAVVVAIVFLVAPAVVFADGRVALVVGNSTYAHIGRLPNPDNDARDMSAALRRLGFEVTTELDADRVELTEALRAFTRQSAGADVSLAMSTPGRKAAQPYTPLVSVGTGRWPDVGGRSARDPCSRAAHGYLELSNLDNRALPVPHWQRP